MAEDEVIELDESTDDPDRERDSKRAGRKIDPMLRAWARMVELNGIEMTISMVVGGRRIGGLMVNIDRFTQEVISSLESATGSGVDSMRKGLQSVPPFNSPELMGELREDDDFVPKVIHLVNASIDGVILENSDGVRAPLSVRLDRVDAWYFGAP